MKPWYKHHYDKVVVPFRVQLYEMADYLSEEDYESLDKMGFSGIGVKVTVIREPADTEVGMMLPSFSIDDVDVEPTDLSLFRDRIYQACDDYVYSNEDDIISSQKVIDAFEYIDEENAA